MVPLLGGKTVRASRPKVKVAVTIVAPSMVTMQAVGAPAGVQPLRLRVEPVAGVAVSVTTPPLRNGAVQVPFDDPHAAMPAGLELTVPLPVPAETTVSTKAAL